MNDGITIDIGESFPYLVDSVLSWFNKDTASVEWKRKIQQLVKLSAERAAAVQCVGMSKPVPIGKIYQPTRLTLPQERPERIFIDDLLARKTDYIIFAGPGWGKTTLLHWLYLRLAAKWDDYVPVLFTLRVPNARQDLEDFVERLDLYGTKGLKKTSKLILLVDGYDEVGEEDRKLVSKALSLFRSLRIGNFYLTCRSFYHVVDIEVEHCYIGSFTHEDAVGFITAFSDIYSIDIHPERLLRELSDHGFSDFAQHPLMLTLVCILKSGPTAEIPRRAIGLIRRAIDTLTLRWDEQKGIHRPTDIPLDGEERVACLMRIAYAMTSLRAEAEKIEGLVKDHLRLLQIKRVDPRRLLDELARWYGILVPVDVNQWQFVHRTMHDYLAARYWVENSGFSSASSIEWNTRAAYATCLLADSTQNLCRMLSESSDIAPFAECLYNQAPFHTGNVALAALKRMERGGRSKIGYSGGCVSAKTDEDFYEFASEELLLEIVLTGFKRGGQASETAALYALAELNRRGLTIKSESLLRLVESMYRSRASVGFPAEVFRRGSAYRFSILDVIVPQKSTPES